MMSVVAAAALQRGIFALDIKRQGRSQVWMSPFQAQSTVSSSAHRTLNSRQTVRCNQPQLETRSAGQWRVSPLLSRRLHEGRICLALARLDTKRRGSHFTASLVVMNEQVSCLLTTSKSCCCTHHPAGSNSGLPHAAGSTSGLSDFLSWTPEEPRKVRPT